MRVEIRTQALLRAAESGASRAAAALGKAVLASMTPYVPYRTGALCRSGTVETAGAHSEIRYTAPYAQKCYYAGTPFRREKHPQACAMWLEAARAVDATVWRDTCAAVFWQKGE